MDQRKLVRIERFERKIGDGPWPFTETGSKLIYDNGDEEEVFELGPCVEREPQR